MRLLKFSGLAKVCSLPSRWARHSRVEVFPQLPVIA